MKLNIDLAEKGGPYGPTETMGQNKEPEVYYPEFTFREDEPPEFPDEGVMTIKYKKVRSSVDKKAAKGKRYSCTLEVHKIISAEGEKDDSPTKRDTRTGDALDKLAKERSKKDEDEDIDDSAYQ